MDFRFKGEVIEVKDVRDLETEFFRFDNRLVKELFKGKHYIFSYF